LVIALAHHEKSAFLKFFLTYFISIALLILVAGFFYFEQMKQQLTKGEHFSLIEYARYIKMGEGLKKFSKDFHHTYTLRDKHISISNFSADGDQFTKYIPTRDSKKYLQVFKSKKPYEKKLSELKTQIILIQTLLLFIFALISYLLAKSALKPLNKSIETLDKFAKDLIHDLNTPVTAMKLNMKIIEKQKDFQKSKAFVRLSKSVESISELHSSLTTLLEEKTFQITKLNICAIVQDVIELHQPNYPSISFEIHCSAFEMRANENALKQILHNLISNACRYNKKDGYVKIYTKGKVLIIEDSGVGIEEPQKIFNRDYSGQNSSGLGLDIVKRLCEAMNIKISVTSSEKGSSFSLEF